MGNNKLINAWDLIDKIADDETKERFELDDILYDIAMKIFDYRKEKGLTQKQLAEKLGMKQAMISKLESGEYNPTIEQLWKISKKLGWQFNILFQEQNCSESDVWDEINMVDDNSSMDFIEKLVKNA
ncbi:MAG: helix-turn-helix transcriptional regulator [Caloramator sp.]|nr:helix-turn-helix transcriptional regulator [Caloramator sp.]